nr:putative diguanylate cyclase YegE [Candidatus Pantoea persica]
MHWRTLTYFGDSMLLILPWKSDNRCTVWYWLIAFGLAGLLVSLSKILFLGFGIGCARFNFTGFSGHSAMSATLWPVMLWLVSGRWPALWRGVTIGVGYVIPLMVSFSRLVIQAHSPQRGRRWPAAGLHAEQRLSAQPTPHRAEGL